MVEDILEVGYEFEVTAVITEIDESEEDNYPYKIAIKGADDLESWVGIRTILDMCPEIEEQYLMQRIEADQVRLRELQKEIDGIDPEEGLEEE